MLRDAYDTLEFWNGIQWEIRMIPFKTAGSTLVSAGRTLYYLGTLHERHYELLNASNTFNLWRMNDNMVFLAVTKIVSIQPGEYYSTLILPLSFLTDCDGIPHCIGYCIYICFIFVLIKLFVHIFRVLVILFHRTRHFNNDNYSNPNFKSRDHGNANYADHNIKNYDPNNFNYTNNSFNSYAPNSHKSIK